MTKKIDFRGVRVSIDESVHSIYEELVSRSAEKAEEFPFITMKDLFVFACCLGVQYNRYEEPKKSKVIFSGEVFDADMDVPILCAIAYSKEKDLDLLFDPAKVIKICQGWAQGGISSLNMVNTFSGGNLLQKISYFISDKA